jgi:preprotein translocase subunit SecD
VPAESVPLVPSLSATGAEFLPTLDGGALCVGPAQASGEVFERDSASVALGQVGGFSVNVELRSDGEAAWNSLATQCFNQLPTCPSTGLDTNGTSRPGQIAIVLDGVVQSAPVVNTPVFDGNVSITGSFSQDEAEQLADVLNRGAFPVQVTPQETRTVSASAGGDSLNAAIISGLIGLALVLIFLVFYYRLLALVIIGGLIIWGMTVYSAAAFVSGATNYALSLAGITGIIVAIGVTVDSYVVFFERMKDEIRNGRTLRNAAPRSFNSTWRTIWSADLVSIIGAVILFSLSVGSVRGFALYLGITTVCDLFVCFFFTRPAVLLLARSKFMVGKRAFGLEVATS